MGRAHHRRFLVSPETIGNGQVAFSPGHARQIVTVLRLREGDLVVVFDGTGRHWTARLTLAKPHRTTARLLEEHPPEAPPRVRLTLAQVVPRGAAMDLIVAKATELGVSHIVPLEAERSVRRSSVTGHVGRWRRIIAEAAEQSGRCIPPDLAAPCSLDDLLRRRPPEQPLLACNHAGESVPLTLACRTLPAPPQLMVLVGGEGGLSPEEVQRVISHEGRLVSLGPRLLRAETAALAALVVVQACLGDWAEPSVAP